LYIEFNSSKYKKQARQAYLVGNKALAKELSVKGQLHNMHMKAAHGKAQESIYRQRFVFQFYHFYSCNIGLKNRIGMVGTMAIEKNGLVGYEKNETI